MDKLLNDLMSWYWWISVVVLGILVNLASSYAKPYLDRWFSARSEASQAKRSAATAAFEVEVERLARDPTLLLIAGQRLQNLQHATLSIGAFLGFLLALSIFLGTAAPKSFAQPTLQIIAAIAAVLAMVVHFAFMRRESELEDTVRAARRRYELVSANNSFKPNPLRGSA